MLRPAAARALTRRLVTGVGLTLAVAFSMGRMALAEGLALGTWQAASGVYRSASTGRATRPAGRGLAGDHGAS